MKKLIMASITAVVVIVVLAGTLIPILDDATATSDTFKNDNALWRMKEIENGDVWTYANSTWQYNSEALPYTFSGESNVIVGDTWMARANGYLRGTTFGGSNIASLTATADTVNVTFSAGSGTLTQSLPGYGVAADGDYVCTAYDKPAYVNGDSPIYATGFTQDATIGNSSRCVIHIEGTIDDGVTIQVLSAYNEIAVTNPTVDNVVIHYSEVSDHKDLYLLEGITFDVSFTKTINDVATPMEYSVSYSSYVVPYEVTAERSVHFTDGENAIFNAIPVMIIIALLLGVVALVLRSRMD